MNRIAFGLFIATLLFVYTASAQTLRAGDSIGAAQVDAIYPDIEKLYIDLHRNPELAFHEQRTAATLAARVKALGYEVTTGVGGTGVVAILKNGPGPMPENSCRWRTCADTIFICRRGSAPPNSWRRTASAGMAR